MNPLPESAVELAARAMLLNWTKFPDTAKRMAKDALLAALPAIREAVVGEFKPLVEAVEDLLQSHPAASTYPDGPCIERQTRRELQSTLAALTEQENRNG